MVRDDDHDQSEASRGEKRSYDLLATLMAIYGDAETRARRSQEEAERKRFLINCVVSELTKYMHRTLKDEREGQQNPNRHDASSSSLSSVESNEPIRAEPIREIKPPVRRKPQVKRKPPVRRKPPVKRKPPVIRKPPVRGKPPVRRVRGVTPEWLVNLMRDENGVDAKLVIERDLTATDLNTSQARLNIPINQIVEMDFLNEAELNIIEEYINPMTTRKTGVDSILVDSSSGKHWGVDLRRWDMKTTSNYVLCSGWKNFFLLYKLEEGQIYQLWSFHSQDGKLYFAFALVPPPPARAPDMAQTMAQPQAQDPAQAVAQPQAQDPAQTVAQPQAQGPAQALVPAVAAASSSAMAPVVTRDSDELYLCEASRLDAEDERNMSCANFPKRRRISPLSDTDMDWRRPNTCSSCVTRDSGPKCSAI